MNLFSAINGESLAAKQGSLRIDANFFNVPPVPLGRTTVLNRLCRLTGQASLLGGNFSFLKTVWCFGIQLLRDGGGAPLLAQFPDRDSAGHRTLPNLDRVVNFYLAGWFGAQSVDLDAALDHLFGGQRSCFVKACGPKPLV